MRGRLVSSNDVFIAGGCGGADRLGSCSVEAGGVNAGRRGSNEKIYALYDRRRELLLMYVSVLQSAFELLLV